MDGLEEMDQSGTTTVQPGGGGDDLEDKKPDLGDGFDDAFEEASKPAGGATGGGKKSGKSAATTTDQDTEKPGDGKEKAAEGKEKPSEGDEKQPGQEKKPATALEAAEEKGKAKAGEGATDQGGTEKPGDAAKEAKTGEEKAGAAEKGKDAKGGAQETKPAPELKLPEKIAFNGQEYSMAAVLEDVGEDAGALGLAIAKGALEQAIESGVVLPKATFDQAMGEVREQLKALQDELSWQEHLNNISDLAGMNARAVLKGKGFQEWLGKQSANIRLLAQQGTADDCALVLKAYADTQAGKRNAKEDQRRAEATQRRNELHSETLRDGQGRFTGRDGGGAGEGDYDSAFDEATSKARD